MDTLLPPELAVEPKQLWLDLRALRRRPGRRRVLRVLAVPDERATMCVHSDTHPASNQPALLRISLAYMVGQPGDRRYELVGVA